MVFTIYSFPFEVALLLLLKELVLLKILEKSKRAVKNLKHAFFTIVLNL